MVKLFDHTKQYTTDALKTVSKRAILKTAEATGDLIGNKIAYKRTIVSETSCIYVCICVVYIYIYIYIYVCIYI